MPLGTSWQRLKVGNEPKTALGGSVVSIRGTERVWIEGGSRNFSQYCLQDGSRGRIPGGSFPWFAFVLLFLYQNNYCYRCKST